MLADQNMADAARSNEIRRLPALIVRLVSAACACVLLSAVLLIAALAQDPLGDSPKPKADVPDKATEPKAEPKAKPKPKPPKRRFYEQNQYDLITLDKANDSVVLKVTPLQFPGQRMPPESKRVGKLKVRLVDEQNQEYEVMWRHIEGIEFFGDLVLRETEKIVERAAQLGVADKFKEAEEQFDEAYSYYQHLLRRFPNTLGLQESLNAYLYINAGVLLKQDRIAEACSVLEELSRRDAQYQHQGGPGTVQAAMEIVGGRLIQSYVDRQDYHSARVLLERLKKDYGNNLKVGETWEEQLKGVAAKQRDEAAAHLAAKRFQQAHELSGEMLKIWPRLEGGRELVLEIARQYPLVVVAVSQPAFDGHDPSSLDSTPSRRAGNLMYRTLLRFTERGPEGGRYACPYGIVQQTDDRKELIFDLREEDTGGRFTGYDLSRHLAALADPAGKSYQSAWASLMSGLDMQGVNRVRVALRRPHVSPHALLQSRLSSDDGLSTRYSQASQDENETRFEPTGDGQDDDDLRPVIVERFYPKPREAITALRKGKIDMIDRILPNDALRLREDPTLVVGQYAFPTLHVLLPNTDNPHLANRTFRRALVYGINREVILKKGLLNQKEVPGCRVVSVPFPAGVTDNDPSAYAYDESIEPYEYDPVMAAILLSLTEQQLGALADMREEEAPVLGELVIAHPPFEMRRFVCKQIQTQLDIVGIKCSLSELPPGRTMDPNGEYDLLYLELAMREPLVDVRRIFGPGGTAPSTDPYVGLTLRQLDEAENWKDARQRLHELHRQINEEVTVIPLWQMVDHFVYHNGLRGVHTSPVFFYQDVDQWRVVPPVLKE